MIQKCKVPIGLTGSSDFTRWWLLIIPICVTVAAAADGWLVGLYVHNQMVVVVVLNKKCKVMNGKMSLFDPALQLSWPMKPAKEKVKENCKNECIKSCII